MADRPELLCPAGDPERLKMALLYGADAVYLAGRSFGMRAAAGNFSDEELAEAVCFAHEKGARVYVTCNTLPREEELPRLPGYLRFLYEIGADALIAADFGVMALAKRYVPELPLHISTQFGVVNSAAAQALHALGADTVVLARELSLEEIRSIRKNTAPKLKLEAFVHGAMCVSFSGRCLLSNYMTGRDANRGECAQPCRWKYHLVEEKRPGEFFEISEDGGTHILNSRDLCLIEHIPELLDAGVTSFKIEGRMKSAYYTAAVTNAYRHALDAALAGQSLSPVWQEEVNMLSHRPYSTGFLFGPPGQFTADARYDSAADVVAVVEECDREGKARLTQRNRISLYDRLELLLPGHEPHAFTVSALYDADGLSIPEVIHPMQTFFLRLPRFAPSGAVVRKRR